MTLVSLGQVFAVTPGEAAVRGVRRKQVLGCLAHEYQIAP